MNTCRYIIQPAGSGGDAVCCGRPTHYRIVMDKKGRRSRRYYAYCPDHAEIAHEEELAAQDDAAPDAGLMVNEPSPHGEASASSVAEARAEESQPEDEPVAETIAAHEPKTSAKTALRKQIRERLKEGFPHLGLQKPDQKEVCLPKTKKLGRWTDTDGNELKVSLEDVIENVAGGIKPPWHELEVDAFMETFGSVATAEAES